MCFAPCGPLKEGHKFRGTFEILPKEGAELDNNEIREIRQKLNALAKQLSTDYPKCDVYVNDGGQCLPEGGITKL